MQISFDIEELKLWPKEHRDFILRQAFEDLSLDKPASLLQELENSTEQGFLGDGTGGGNRSLIYSGVAARDGECCAQCGETENLVIDFKVPIALGGSATVDNAQLLCKKHNAIKGHRISDITLIDAISVEAAVALLEGLGGGSRNVLKAIVSLGSTSGVQRAEIMDAPDFNLKFKDGRSLNGVLTGIRKRFRSLLREGERNRFDLLEYDDVKDTYSLGEGTYWAIKEAFSYIEASKESQEISKINQNAINLYRQGVGQTLVEFKFSDHNTLGTMMDTALVLPDIGPKSPSNKPRSLQEHFPFEFSWVVYGGDSKVKADD